MYSTLIALFLGFLCEININDCDPDPCYHGSQCIDDVNDYRCICTPGFEGNCNEFLLSVDLLKLEIALVQVNFLGEVTNVVDFLPLF